MRIGSKRMSPGVGTGEEWGGFSDKVTVMSCTHKLMKILAKVRVEMSLEGGTGEEWGGICGIFMKRKWEIGNCNDGGGNWGIISLDPAYHAC